MGLGASAGGIEALKRFLSAVPNDSGMAFVVVMHLDPSQESNVVEVFQSSTEMKIVQASKQQLLEPNHIYVIAPYTYLEVSQGALISQQPEEPHGQRMPVDKFLSSLAREHKQKSAAIIFSGTGSDGQKGVSEIKDYGGLCLVQDPATAQHRSMPDSAISTKVVDRVLSPEQMPDVLLERIRVLDAQRSYKKGAESKEPFDQILHLLGREYGINFQAFYKKGTLERRTEARMNQRQIKDWGEYLDVLEKNPEEVKALYEDLLIGVTQFFRDKDIWKSIEKQVVPEIIQAHQDVESPIRIWVPGCGTGEEAYSLAIVFLEQLEELEKVAPDIQIFATDVAQNALSHGRRAIYTDTIREFVSEKRLSQYFHEHGDGWQINQFVRDKVTFAAHNLLSDPPFTQLDLVSCRNVLIYLEAHAQQRILELFHFGLKTGGWLLLGASESIGQQDNLFQMESDKNRLFRSVAKENKSYHNVGLRKAGPPLNRLTDVQDPVPKGPKINRYIEQFVLRRHTAACVAVSDSGEIHSFFGPVEKYLSQPTGEVNMDLLAWVKPGLYPRLRAAFEEAGKNKKPVQIGEMYVERAGESQRVTTVIEPIIPLPGQSTMYLITFRDGQIVESEEEEAPVQVDSKEHNYTKQLELELKSTREELNSTIEQLEHTNEEYQASHEELLALNEELQSNNEELEASKEELQSLNEELTTVNQQLQHKNEELGEVSGDLKNLLASTAIPILLLDRRRQIRRFTPAATEVMSLVNTDVGRPIENIRAWVQDDNLIEDVQAVLKGTSTSTRETQTEEGKKYVRQVLPYKTEDGRIEGVCVTYYDVTEREKAAQQSEEARVYAEAIVETIQTSVLVLDSDFRVTTVNAAFCNTFEISRTDCKGTHIFELGAHEWDFPEFKNLLEKDLPERDEIRDFEVEHKFKNLGRRVIRLNALRMPLVEKNLILIAIEDITDQKDAERQVKERAEELTKQHQRKDEFLAMLGHELRNPLSALMHGLNLLELTQGQPQQVEEAREMMVRQAHRVSSMLDQLLDVARLSAGKIHIEKIPVDLVEAAETAVEAVAQYAKSKGQTLDISLGKRGQVFVKGDSARLTQIIENLLNNAAKYTDEGGDIWLRLEKDEDYVQIYVCDNGPGIDDELLPHIFEVFTQATRTLERTEGGLGLGLPLVKDLVELHGGQIEVKSSSQEKGSEFIVTLPRTTSLPEEPENRKTSNHTGELNKKKFQRVLVVEDEKDLADSLVKIIKAHGFEVRATYDGLSAKDEAVKYQPDVVLLDLGLPGMDGYKLAQELREELKDKDMRIIAVTGYKQDSERLKEMGIDYHLLKPPDMKELFSWLDKQ